MGQPFLQLHLKPVNLYLRVQQQLLHLLRHMLDHCLALLLQLVHPLPLTPATTGVLLLSLIRPLSQAVMWAKLLVLVMLALVPLQQLERITYPLPLTTGFLLVHPLSLVVTQGKRLVLVALALVLQ